jgi:hypothetical protein
MDATVALIQYTLYGILIRALIVKTKEYSGKCTIL